MSYNIEFEGFRCSVQYGASGFSVSPLAYTDPNNLISILGDIGCSAVYLSDTKTLVVDAPSIQALQDEISSLTSQLISANEGISSLQEQVSSIANELDIVSADVTNYLVNLAGITRPMLIYNLTENASTYSFDFTKFSAETASAHVNKTYDADAQRLFEGKAYIVINAQLIDELGAFRPVIYHY